MGMGRAGFRLTCQVLVHCLHLHLGPCEGLLNGPVLILLQGLHLLQHLPMCPLQLCLIHGNLTARPGKGSGVWGGKKGKGKCGEEAPPLSWEWTYAWLVQRDGMACFLSPTGL